MGSSTGIKASIVSLHSSRIYSWALIVISKILGAFPFLARPESSLGHWDTRDSELEHFGCGGLQGAAFNPKSNSMQQMLKRESDLSRAYGWGQGRYNG